jgi:Sulfotransferase family
MAEWFRRGALAVQRRFNDFDPSGYPFDEALVDGAFAPVFILGPPRSGSTLLYQVLLQQLQLGFISNVMSAIPRHMVLLCRLWTGFGARAPRRIRPADYGFIKGLLAPSEAGKVLDKWFSDGVVHERRSEVRRTFAALASLVHAPVLIKSLSLVNKLDNVRCALPKARYIILNRDPIFTIQSILMGRRDPHVTADRWLGIQPPGFERISESDDVYQACWIVRQISDGIAQALKDVEGSVVTVRYEGLCENPTREVTTIADRLDLKRRVKAVPLPIAFPASDAIRLAPATWQHIERTYRSLS